MLARQSDRAFTIWQMQKPTRCYKEDSSATRGILVLRGTVLQLHRRPEYDTEDPNTTRENWVLQMEIGHYGQTQLLHIRPGNYRISPDTTRSIWVLQGNNRYCSVQHTPLVRLLGTTGDVCTLNSYYRDDWPFYEALQPTHKLKPILLPKTTQGATYYGTRQMTTEYNNALYVLHEAIMRAVIAHNAWILSLMSLNESKS